MAANANDHRYDDIIHLPHHVSTTRPPMAAADRAAQFSPFAALTGFGAVITETERLTDEKPELDEYEKTAINDRLLRLQEQLRDRPLIAITFFRPDEKKAGGAYVTVSGAVKKLDSYARLVILATGEKIPIDDILEISDVSPE